MIVAGQQLAARRNAGTRWSTLARGLVALAAIASLSSCATRDQIGNAIADVNSAFRVQYEAIIAQQGTRTVNLRRADALEAVRAALVGLGMQLEITDPGLGYLSAYAPAPRPLDLAEWQQATAAD